MAVKKLLVVVRYRLIPMVVIRWNNRWIKWYMGIWWMGVLVWVDR